MSGSDKFPSNMRSGKSDNIEPNDLPYFGLSGFDTRNSNVDKKDKKDKENNNKNRRYIIRSPMIQTEY